jgi:hypothetical protein
MKVWILYLHHHRKEDIPVTYQYICKSEEAANNIIEEKRKSFYNHAEEILDLFEKNEVGYLLKTVRFKSTIDFMNSDDLTECETKKDIINEIIRFEFFNHHIEERELNFSDSDIIMYSMCSLY